MRCEHLDTHLASERDGKNKGGNHSDLSEGGN